MPDYVLYRVRALLPLAGGQGPHGGLVPVRSGGGMDDGGWKALAQLLSRWLSCSAGHGTAGATPTRWNEQVTTLCPQEQGRRPRRGQQPDGQRMGADAALR